MVREAATGASGTVSAVADFSTAQAHVIEREGGYKLVDVEDDRGGRTYAGISERANPDWIGWPIIDKHGPDDARLPELADQLYAERYWDRVDGDAIDSQDAGDALYSCAVLAGARTSVRLVQSALGATVDGIMGKRTLRRINGMGATQLLPIFTLLRIARYAAICNRDKSQKKFLLGWLNRALLEDGDERT